MTQSVLREKLARLGPVLEGDRVTSGSREVVILRLGPNLSATKTISATMSLRKRHVPTLKAKRAVEAAVAGKYVILEAPMVEDLQALAGEMKEFGFSMSVVTNKGVDVKRIRERLGMTQEQFALTYGLDVDAIRNWEYGRREPDQAAKSYLTVIDRRPELAQDALAAAVI